MIEVRTLSASERHQLTRTPDAHRVAAATLTRIRATVTPWLRTCHTHFPGLFDEPHLTRQMHQLSVFSRVDWRLLPDGRLIGVRPSAGLACECATPDDWWSVKCVEICGIARRRVERSGWGSLETAERDFLDRALAQTSRPHLRLVA